MISSSKDILPFLVYPTVFQRYPTVWIDSNPYPTIACLSNRFPEISNHFLIYPTTSFNLIDSWFIQPFFKNIQPFGLDQTHIPLFSIYPTVFQRFSTVWIALEPYPTISGLSNHFCRYPTIFFIYPTISLDPIAYWYIQPQLDIPKTVGNEYLGNRYS